MNHRHFSFINNLKHIWRGSFNLKKKQIVHDFSYFVLIIIMFFSLMTELKIQRNQKKQEPNKQSLLLYSKMNEKFFKTQLNDSFASFRIFQMFFSVFVFQITQWLNNKEKQSSNRQWKTKKKKRYSCMCLARRQRITTKHTELVFSLLSSWNICPSELMNSTD